MTETRIKVSSIVDNQLPQFVKEEFPLVSEFLSQYYISLENQGGTSDILQNIDQYIKVDNLTNLIESTVLTSDVTFFDSTINVISTAGFPDSYGLLLVDSEIITYTSKTSTSFEGCVRGFSGITSYQVKDELTFTESQSEEHISGTIVNNLSIIFLKEFLNKVKKQITPGFENRELYSELDERLFIKQSIDFYSSKGTDNSFKILFGALYGQNVEVIRPRDYLIQPSDAQYRVTSDLVVETIEGNPEDLVNGTLYQDKTDFMSAAQGTITKVEKIRRGSKDYYVISLDSDYDKDIQPIGTIYGKFTIHPKTRLVSSAVSGTTTLEVDSTVAFPTKNGNLVINLENDTSLSITYTTKTLNQFLGCSGINQDIPKSTEIKTDTYAYGYSDNDKIKIIILGVLSELEIPKDTKFYSKDDTIKIKTLGIDLKDYKSNNWFFNIPVKYDVKSIRLLDSSDKSYTIEVYDNHSIKVGDFITLKSSSGFEQSGYVTFFNNEKSFSVQFGSEQLLLDTNLIYTVKKNLAKVLSENYPSVNQYTSNIQNVYYDEESLYIAAPSLPTYLNYLKQPLKINDQSVTFSGTFDGTILDIGKHGFYTGDSIVYNPSIGNNLGISTGVYFIKKVNETQVKLSRSRSNIFTENFINIDATVSNAKFELSDFTYRDFSTQLLESQKLIRKISNPEIDGKIYETEPGLTGIFINGVELLNYKSKDNVYYGPIEKITPTAGGTDYDIINPPVLSIIDPIGFGANGYCSVIGGLERIDIIDPGFDYLEEPKIEITGGNGLDASAQTNLVSFDHEVSFNSQSSAGLVKLNPTNTIGFSSYHKFRDAEEVIYITNGGNSISGLTTNSNYFVSVQDGYKIKLHKSFSDAVVGINTIQLTSFGTGIHAFKSKNKKKKIGSIIIKNSGKNYQNKLTTVNSIGINTASNIITIKDHGYQNGEIVVYNSTQTPIGGLSSSTSYYVTKVNEDQFKLSSIGIGTLGITTSFYYDTKQFINLTSTGNGLHKFNYPEIKILVKGNIGVSTLSGQDFNGIVQPIFRGEIQSVFVESGGTKYGSEDIINYNRQPLIELNSGSGVELKPIISNGKIVDVLVTSFGKNYNAPPTLKVIGDGVGAVLTPIISDGHLVEVKVIHGGGGYNDSNTSIISTSAGIGAKFESKIKSWKINLVERTIQSSKITSDDGILSSGLNSEYGLQYSHAYAPRQLRTLVQATSFKEGKTIYVSDLQILDSKEVTSNSHSPIIGWAYDGNPIYGPYGYTSKTGGSIKCMVPGYKLKISNDRPGTETSIYPFGFFVEDYEYTGEGDLDEHNGRFCITPEYPNGVYAYFSTINSGEVETTGLFEKYKKPVFPYVIGPTYKSKPISFNFDNYSNQDFIDINETKWKRNTTPYNILNQRSSYEYFLNPNDIKPQYSVIRSINNGTIDSIKVDEGGKDYKVGDRLVFKNKGKYISEAKAKVSLVKGKEITQISVATSSYENVTLYPYENQFIGFTTVPHNYLSDNIITFTGKFDYKKSGNIIVNVNNLVLTTGVGSAQYTGLVTYFNVSGNLNYPNIKENDIYQIANEQVKVLNIDLQSSRIRVLRNQNNTIGLTTYSAGIAITEKTKKFFVNFGISTSYNSQVNRELYFNPVESIGIGTISGVGIVSTIYISNPGVGITQFTIPTQTIYLPKHNLNTGDSLIYSSNGGTRVSVSTDGISTFQLNEDSIVYVAKISSDLIGISTIKVGIGSTGTFVGVGSTTSGILYFTSVGTGTTHSFKTDYQNSLTGTISKNIVTVSTADTHGLSLRDNVIIDAKVGITTTFSIKYDDYNRRVLINPRSFSFIDTTNNTISIYNHKYYTGQKVLHTSNSPAAGLTNQGLYYVIVVDSNTIMLSDSYYGSIKNNPNIIDISSSASGTLSPINPPIQVTKNQSIVFDLSDPSLSYFSSSGVATYSAFDFKIYKDNEFIEEFDTTQSSSIFEVSKVGKIGIDFNAKVTIITNDKTPSNLYYKLVPTNLKLSPQIKKDIIIDDEVISANKISLIECDYNGRQSIVGVGSTYFEFNSLEKPQFELLTSDSNNIQYYTDSPNVNGSIQQILVTDGGKGYDTLPSVSSILSDSGYDAILTPTSNSIGKVSSVEIQDIGFEYPSDYSIRPTSRYPDILVLDTLSSFDYIGINSFGKNYNTVPSLVVIDGLTNKVIEGVDLTYSFGDSNITIIKNTSELNNTIPKIIPINNSNGVKIKNIVFNDSTKDVVVSLAASFSNPEDFPFEIGSKVLIEGTNVGIATTGKGYNSSNYNYSLFTLTGVTTALGGIGASITYNLSSYLIDGEVPGKFNSFNSSGRVVPESYFPLFDPILKNNTFYKGETVYSSTAVGDVQTWDSHNQYLKVSTINDFVPKQTIIGKTSGSVAIIKDILKFESQYKIDSFSTVKKGWNRETGFLNNDFQRVHDSDYYQYFSYALKSQKDLETWNNPVSTLNHTSGFKKFGNLIIESNPLNAGISTQQNQGDFSATSDLSSIINLNCINDFDLAKENNLDIDFLLQSDKIIFNSAIVQDYIESIGNRVLIIDDISNQFNSNPRSTTFTIADAFILNDFRSKKYLALVTDKRNPSQSELSFITLLHDNSFGFLNQYANLSSGDDLGSFDFSISGTEANLLYYPIKSKFNNYHIQLFSFSLNDINSGIGTLSLGNSVEVDTHTSTIVSGTSSPISIVGIASTYRSAKILVQIGAVDSSYFEYDEITYIHDGTNVHLLDYGQLSTDIFSSESSSGIGTYNAYLSGNIVNIDLIVDQQTNVDYTVNTLNVSLASTFSSGTGTKIIEGGTLISSSVAISSSPSPISTVIGTYSNLTYNCSYSIISIENTTNSEYQISEFMTLTSDSNCYNTEFGRLKTNSSIGTISAEISGTDTNIYFTPIKDIDVEIKVFTVNLSLNNISEELSFINGSLNYDYGSYTGTENDIKKEFDLTHNNLPIFQRTFDGSSSNIVNIESNTIKIPNHFYVTGEKILYSYSNNESTSPIGIATTSIIGIGVTDKLPSSLYVVKVNDLDIQVAVSASEALKTIPNVLTLTSVGTGSSHAFTSTNQNKKVIIGIDNLIQSPIVSTSITTILSENLTSFDSEVYVSGIGSIYGGDLIKIDDEIMKVSAVGVASTNAISVIRPWMGTGISTHVSSSLVTKVIGNYNIMDNTLYFAEAPFGQIPFTNPSSRPDEFDYIGISTGSSFSGRVFLRSGVTNTSEESYASNYIFDDISNNFNGSQKTFTLKSNNTNVSGISTDNAILLINSIFQGPTAVDVDGDYNLIESVGITSVTFTGNEQSTSYDVNTSSVPRGGIILSVGSSQGFGYQPLVSAGGTVIVSFAGTIQSVSIGNSGSGYRSGIQNIINVGVKTENLESSRIEYIGTAAVTNGRVVSIAITNPGVGYTSSNPPIVIFDSPLSYSNLPLIYSSKSPIGVGTGAVVDIVVGQGSSVISFELKNLGYGYKIGDILTISSDQTLGIPTTSSASFSEFTITVDDIQSDQFSGWSLGSLQVIDPLDELFDGKRTIFPILIEGNQVTIRSKRGSNIDVQSTLLIFINDVLQVPGEGYTFAGGSTITFTEAPKENDTSKIIFYKGTSGVDTQTVDILETIKVGDTVSLNSDNALFKEEDRLVTEIISSDTLETNLYPGPGISQNTNLLRPIVWCKQTEDKFINGKFIAKDRIIYEPYIQPISNIIQNVGVTSDVIFVESVKSFFDSEREYLHDGTSETPQNKILIVSQDNLISAAATAVVSISGTISSIVISDGGVGYNTTPTVSIQKPSGYIVSTAGNVGVNTNIITGINTENIAVGYEIFEPLNIVSSGSTVTFVGINSIHVSKILNPDIFKNIDFLTTQLTSDQTVSAGSTIIFVDSISNVSIGSSLTITENLNNVSVVSVGDTYVNIGFGDTIATPITSGLAVTFSNPTSITEPQNNIIFKIGLGSTAIGIASLTTNGTVSSISILNSGIGYTISNPPVVFIESPKLKYEVIDNVSYEGDFGIITGIKTTSVGVASTGIIFDFFIPLNSFLRDGETVTTGTATTGVSGIQTGYYFIINNSNVGGGLTSLNSSGGVVGVGTTFIDNIYQVAEVSIGQTAVAGVGITYVAKVTANVSGYNNLSGFGFSSFYGEYSWGKISIPVRKDPQEFTSYASVGGISSSPIVQRFNRLKYLNYNT